MTSVQPLRRSTQRVEFSGQDGRGEMSRAFIAWWTTFNPSVRNVGHSSETLVISSSDKDRPKKQRQGVSTIIHTEKALILSASVMTSLKTRAPLQSREPYDTRKLWPAFQQVLVSWIKPTKTLQQLSIEVGDAANRFSISEAVHTLTTIRHHCRSGRTRPTYSAQCRHWSARAGEQGRDLRGLRTKFSSCPTFAISGNWNWRINWSVTQTNTDHSGVMSQPKHTAIKVRADFSSGSGIWLRLPNALLSISKTNSKY